MGKAVGEKQPPGIGGRTHVVEPIAASEDQHSSHMEDEQPNRRSGSKTMGTTSRLGDWIRQVSGASTASDIFGFAERYGDASPSNGARRKDSAGERTVFADAEGMKAKVRASLHEPTYNVADFYKEEGLCQAVAKSQRFETLTLSVVAMNSIWIAIDTDYNSQDVLTESDVGFQFVAHLFCGFFVFEWCVRFLAFENKCDALKDRWFILDSVLVPMMVFEVWILSAMVWTSGRDSSFLSSDNDSSILRLLRLLRLFRMARVARLLRATPEIMTLIKAMAAALRSVFFTLCLLVIVMYVFGVGFAQLCAATPLGDKYFRSVPEAMYTLLLRGTLLCNVSFFMNEVRAENGLAAVMFMAFILIAAITVMNMLVGVLCEVVGTAAAVEKEEQAVGLVKGRLEKIICTLDTNSDGLISQTEFAKLLENREACKALQEVGVDPVGLVDFADILFQEDGEDNNFDKKMTFVNFMELVLELRGSCTATVKDIVNMRKYIRNAQVQTGDLMHQTNLRLAKLEGMLQKLLSQNNRGPSRMAGLYTCTSTPSSRTTATPRMAFALKETAEDDDESLAAARGAPVAQGQEYQVSAGVAAATLLSPKHPASAGVAAARSEAADIQSMTSALEADLATTFDELQVRIRELAQALPPLNREEASQGGAGEKVGAADDRRSNENEVKEVADVDLNGARKRFDPDELTITEVEAELLNFATPKSSGPESNGSIVGTSPCLVDNFFSVGVVPLQEAALGTSRG